MAGIAIGFINQKGGVLKTTLSTMFATSIYYGSKTAVGFLDGDLQNSAADTRDIERFLLKVSPKLVNRFTRQSQASGRTSVYPIKRTRMDNKEILQDLPAFKNKYGLTIVDVPGTFYVQDYIDIIKEIEIIIIPVHTEDKVQIASLELLALIDHIRKTDSTSKIKGVGVAFVKYSRNQEAEFEELKDYLLEKDVFVFDNVIKESKRFHNYTSPKFKEILQKYQKAGGEAEGIAALNEEEQEYLTYMAEREQLTSTIISFPELSKNADISPAPLFKEILTFIQKSLKKN